MIGSVKNDNTLYSLKLVLDLNVNIGDPQIWDAIDTLKRTISQSSM